MVGRLGWCLRRERLVARALGLALAGAAPVAACGEESLPATPAGAGGAEGGGDGGGAGEGGAHRAGTGGDAGDGGAAADAGRSGAGQAGADAGAGRGGRSSGGQAGMEEPGGAGAGQGATTGGGGTSAGKPSFPEHLSEAGLYADLANDVLADGVEAYHPRYELWSDGAEKRRWVKLPAATTIDTSDLDYWSFPVDTRLFKEFSRDGKRIETRLLHKQAGGWAMVAYLWNDELTEATAVPDGVLDVKGTDHDVPSSAKCAICHDKMPDRVLGFGALQLAHDEDGATLATLAERDLLSDPPSGALTPPGDATASSALGYLHANCGICHNPRSFVSEVSDLDLWLESAKLGSVEETSTYRSAVNQAQKIALPGADALIVAGDPRHSAVVLRMQRREDEDQMPPVGSELADSAGLAAVSAWIESLE